MSRERTKNLLDAFKSSGKIPNILLWGDAGSGKKTLLQELLDGIYDGTGVQEKLVMRVECGYGKGIKFIRDELKFFGQSLSGSSYVKSVVLLNGDRLTLDAQSALRRCIEQYNHSTRFFMVVEDKHKILSPILSRFCVIHVPRRLEAGREVNLHMTAHCGLVHPPDPIRIATRLIAEHKGGCIELAEKLYSRGCSVLDVMVVLERIDTPPEAKFNYLEYIEYARSSIDNELMLLFMVLTFMEMRHVVSLGNMMVL
jgi:DNA polymerase III delta prime subunit